MNIIKRIINHFKHIKRCYKLGRHILKNLYKLDNFNCNNGLLQKNSNHIPEYLGTIHTISYIDNEYFVENSMIKLDN